MMSTETFKTKYWILTIISCVIVALIYTYSHFLMGYMLGGEGKIYSPLVKNFNSYVTVDELYLYGSRIQEVYDGNFSLSDSNLFEHKDKPYMLPFLGELVAGNLGSFLGLDIMSLQVWGDVVFPVIIFLLIFAFIYDNTKYFHYSISLAFLMMVMFEIFSILLRNPHPKLIAKYFTDPHLFLFSRMVQVEVVLPFLILALYFTVKALKESNLLFLIGAGISTGLMFYANFYMWTYYYAFMVSLILISFFYHDNAEIKTIIKILLISSVISIPYWINFVELNSIENIKDLINRTGITYGRGIHLLSAVYLMALFVAYKVMDRKNFGFKILAASIIGLLICKNIQLITGYTIQSGHWDQRAAHPVIFLLVGVSFGNYLKNKLKQSWVKHISLIIIAISVLYGFYSQHNYSTRNYKHYAIDRKLLEAFDFLNAQTKKDEVVMCTYKLTHFIPTYTHNNIYIPIPPVTMADDKEIKRRLQEVYGYLSYERNSLKEFLKSQEGYYNLYHMGYGDNIYTLTRLKEIMDGTIRIKPKRLTDKEIDEIIEGVDDDIISSKFTYKADYLLIDKGEIPYIGKQFDLKKAKELNLIYDNGQYAAYKFKK